MATDYEFSPIVILDAFLAICEVVLVMVPGVYYARKGVVSVEVRRKLSLISFGLLLPAMNFYHITGNVSASTIVDYIPFAVNTVLSNTLGILLGYLVAWLCVVPRALRNHVVAASGFGNMNSLPLLIVASVCNQEHMPFYQVLGAQCTSVGWAYVAVGSAATQMLTYPFAIWLLKKRPEPAGEAASLPQLVRSLTRRMSKRVSRASLRTADDTPAALPAPGTNGTELAALSQEQQSAAAPSADSPQPPASDSGGGSPPASGSRFVSLGGESASEPTTSEEAELEPKEDSLPVAQVPAAGAAASAASGAAAAEPVQPVPAWKRHTAAVWQFTRENVLRAPCIGAGAGLVVGCITPIKDLLFPQQTAALGFLMGALESIQAALVFVTSFVLGAILSKGPGPGSRPLGWKPLVLVTLVRMVLLPVLGAIIVVGSVKAGIYMPSNPVFAYVLMAQYCVPTANQMQNIAAMNGNREKEMGALVFWQYVASFAAIPAFTVFYVWLMDFFELFPQA
ncbi:hypothetical protein ABPG75_004174 [Micractinium tetrahymenae]